MKILNWLKSNNRIVAGVITCGTASIYFLVLAINLIGEERYRPATGMIILSAVLIGYISLLFYNPEKNRISSVAKKIKRDIKIQESSLQTVFSTKDLLLVTYIEEALKEHSIKCFIFDEQANAMMNFIDGMEMRVLIHKDDYEKNMVIVNEIIEQSQKAI